ncbi:hypothetical protein H9639_13290 [Arthrobacter sp. Sa2CUA1]|uniref:Uncharacterized protein n=1 Tax=Arthrobacter gallicola TaxID=2762225 RepID=A0ABR8UV71_9MICC|nr:hypothetical protein [Arthrobacter gallicola]MBD7996272.1 hypothetical protein [Arthrobacter gallicola]
MHSGTLDGTPGSTGVLGDAGAADVPVDVPLDVALGDALVEALDGLEAAEEDSASSLLVAQPPRSNARAASPLIRAGDFETVVLMVSP